MVWCQVLPAEAAQAHEQHMQLQEEFMRAKQELEGTQVELHAALHARVSRAEPDAAQVELHARVSRAEAARAEADAAQAEARCERDATLRAKVWHPRAGQHTLWGGPPGPAPGGLELRGHG